MVAFYFIYCRVWRFFLCEYCHTSRILHIEYTQSVLSCKIIIGCGRSVMTNFSVFFLSFRLDLTSFIIHSINDKMHFIFCFLFDYLHNCSLKKKFPILFSTQNLWYFFFSFFASFLSVHMQIKQHTAPFKIYFSFYMEKSPHTNTLYRKKNISPF